ncbi:hypothetical protein NEICINOT_03205 [Neisseria cinerea ATCC 14685]|uniref:Uncharacterized protein n=1 Tax=Neisseria cinerea ATCC 14685 TaxID=546262 RepID=D0W0N9_NEICI|nr:hypothetical protein NEICINOT_03205 [Neisseria cinerea ATCC 14685]
MEAVFQTAWVRLPSDTVSVYRNDASKERDSLLLSLFLLCMKIRNNGRFCQYKIWSACRLWK